MTDEVHIHTHGAAGHISLNRPKAIHALTLDMCHAMSGALAEWADDDEIEAVILDHAEGRGFCAGGDINLLRHSALNDGGASGRRFFHDEYQLNHQMMTYAKPIVAFMDGITMGGGVGIALPCKYRVATENTRFAMPETGIGLFPDVGGGWHLARLGGRLGQFLAKLNKIADEFNIAVVYTNQVQADPSGMSFAGMDPKKAIGGHVLAHASHVRLSVRKGRGDARVIKVVDAPNLKEAEAEFIITDGGVVSSDA